MQTRIFQINYLASRRQGVTDTRVTSSSPSVVNPGGTSGTGAGGVAPPPTAPGAPGQLGTSSADSSRVQTRTDADFWKDLGTALTTIVGTGDRRNVILNALRDHSCACHADRHSRRRQLPQGNAADRRGGR